MRLKDEEKKKIIQAVKDFFSTNFSDESYELFLFGSRVDDALKGGDIDLLLVVDAQKFSILSVEKHKLVRRLKDALGDQKIDLLVSTEELLKTDQLKAELLQNAVNLGKSK